MSYSYTRNARRFQLYLSAPTRKEREKRALATERTKKSLTFNREYRQTRLCLRRSRGFCNETKRRDRENTPRRLRNVPIFNSTQLKKIGKKKVPSASIKIKIFRQTRKFFTVAPVAREITGRTPCDRFRRRNGGARLLKQGRLWSRIRVTEAGEPPERGARLDPLERRAEYERRTNRRISRRAGRGRF